MHGCHWAGPLRTLWVGFDFQKSGVGVQGAGEPYRVPDRFGPEAFSRPCQSEASAINAALVSAQFL